MNHLLGLMYNRFVDREIFPMHVALVPMVSYPSLFKELYDFLSSKVANPQYHFICTEIIASFATDWRDGVHDSALLSETYNYNKGLDYKIPYNFQNQQHLTALQLAALREVCLTSQNHYALTQFEINVIDGHKLLKFLRNRLAHRMEAIAAGYGVWINRNCDLSAICTEMVTRVKFPLVVAVIQMHLHWMGYDLKKLMLDDLF